MRKDIVKSLACPKCRGSLEIASCTSQAEENRIQDGSLSCLSCAAIFPVVQYIPRFVPLENYAASFGFEWQKHSRTQIDKFNGTSISRDRFYRSTNWPSDLRGQRVLEVGCGSGRFTQIILDAGADVFSVDYSSAVDVNIDNNGINPRLNVFQADLYALPFLKDSFDKILCLGVLQHTPDTRRAFLSLPQYLRAGGELVVDVYARSWETYFAPKFWLRPVTKRIPERFLYSIIQRTVPVLLPIKTRVRSYTPKVGRYLAGMIPVANFYGAYDLTDAQQRQWSILDTFDALSPEYDNPQRIEDVKNWFTEAGMGDTEVDFVSIGIIRGRGTKPHSKRAMSG